MIRVRCIPLMIPIVALAGCEATTFEKPPLAETACDPQLVGYWLTVPDGGSNDPAGEGEFQIDATCKLVAIDHKQDQTGADTVQTSNPTQLHVGRDGAQGYLWVDSAWAFRFAQSDQAPPPGDVTVLRYDINAGGLALSMTADRAIAHRIIDGDLDGEVHKLDGTLLDRLTGVVSSVQLRNKVAFSDKPAHFIRHATESAQ